MSLGNKPLLLRVGFAMMLSAIVLAAVMAAMIWLLSGGSSAISAPSKPVAAHSAAQEKRHNKPTGHKLKIDNQPLSYNQTKGDKETKVHDQPPTDSQAKSAKKTKAGKRTKAGNKAKVTNDPPANDQPTVDNEPTATNEPAANNEPSAENQAKASPQPTAVSDPLPALSQHWPEPPQQEVATADAPRYYQPTHDSTLSLTVQKIGLYDVPVINSNNPEALDRGVIHLLQTPMPWDTAQQKNVYLAGHRIGYEGTGSRLVFYNLNQLKKGDPIVLKDGSGNPYEYG